MKRLLTRLAAAAALLLSAAALLPGAAQARDYRLGLITPPPHQWTKTAQQIAAEIAEQTGGRVNILVFPSGQLGDEARILQQLQTGAIDFAMLTMGEFANRDPNYGIFYAPYLARDHAQAQALLKGPTAQELLAGMRSFGLHGLGWGMAGLRQIVTADEVTEAAQLAGQKIRTVPLQPSMDFWSLLGAAPTPMPLPALYDAFANGQVDGMQIDHEGTWNSAYWRHAGSVLNSDHMMFPMAAVASGRMWQGMAPEDAAVVSDVFARHMDEMIALYREIDARYLDELRGTGVPVIDVDRAWFGDAVPAWYAQWREKAPMLGQLEREAAGE